MEDNTYCTILGHHCYIALVMAVQLNYSKYNVTPRSPLQKGKSVQDTMHCIFHICSNKFFVTQIPFKTNRK